MSRITLVELLAVIVILGVLLLVALPAVTGAQKTAKQRAAIDGALAFQKAISTYVTGADDLGLTGIGDVYEGNIGTSACAGTESSCAYYATDSTTGKITAFYYVNSGYGIKYDGSGITLNELRQKISALNYKNLNAGLNTL